MQQSVKHRARPWIVLVGLAVLAAGHAVILYYVSSHRVVSFGVIAGIAGLVLVKHLGLFGSAYGLLRKALRRRE